jgi:hypothetical protein
MAEFIYQRRRADNNADRSEKPAQASKGQVLQDNRQAPVQRQEKEQRQENDTGLPDNLKSGMENLSGINLSHVRVHYSSGKPATVQAHAYAQGADIHLASGQEKNLGHELGHVVQQAQGRVQPTTSVGGMAVNDNAGLESEATAMGAKALQRAAVSPIHDSRPDTGVQMPIHEQPLQLGKKEEKFLTKTQKNNRKKRTVNKMITKKETETIRNNKKQ